MAALTDAQIQAAQDAGASSSDLKALLNLKERAAEFERARVHLLSLGPAVVQSGDTALITEHAKLVQRADAIKSQVQAALKAIDDAIRWARGFFGLQGFRTLGALGVVWFLPLAVISAAVGVIGFWLNDYAKFSKRFAEQERIAAELRKAGMGAGEANRQAAAVVAGTFPSWLQSVGTVAAWGGVLLVGWWLWRRGAR